MFCIGGHLDQGQRGHLNALLLVKICKKFLFVSIVAKHSQKKVRETESLFTCQICILNHFDKIFPSLKVMLIRNVNKLLTLFSFHVKNILLLYKIFRIWKISFVYIAMSNYAENLILETALKFLEIEKMSSMPCLHVLFTVDRHMRSVRGCS